MDGNDLTRAVVQTLDSCGIPYMCVGSFASNLYGVCRATKDADIVVQCGASDIVAVARQLGAPFRLDPQSRFESVTATFRHVITIEGDPFQIDLFRLSDEPYDQERFRRRVQSRLAGTEYTAYVCTAEDIVVTKLRWALFAQRGKDRDDIRDVIAIQGDSLDWDYIQFWCGQHGTRALLDGIRRGIPPEEPR